MDVNSIYQSSLASQIAYTPQLSSGLSGASLTNRIIASFHPDSVTNNQASLFSSEFRVVRQSTISSTGFSATLFESLQNPGAYTLAFRGSSGSLADPDWTNANLSNALFGIAFQQVVDSVNFYLRLTHSGVVNQYSADYVFLNPALPAPSSEYFRLGQFGNLIGYASISLSGTAQGFGDISAQTPLTITGHSLGGHLASAFTLLFPEVSVETYTFNSAGFIGWLGDRFSSFANALTSAVTDISISPVSASSASAFDFASPLDLVSRIPGADHLGGQTMEIASEVIGSSPLDDILHNHAIDPIVDAMAVINTLNSLDSSVSLAIGNQILKASSNTSELELERAANHLANLFGFPSVSVGMTNHNDIYSLLASLETALGQSILGLDSLSRFSSRQLFNIASLDNSEQSKGFRFALTNLSPFALVEGLQYSTAASTGYDLENFTPQHLRDLSLMLNVSLEANDKNLGHGLLAQPMYFNHHDSESAFNADYLGQVLYEGHNPGASPEDYDPFRSHIVFGSSEENTPTNSPVTASANDDHLYGLGGQDIIEGLDGDDYIEGGSGNDDIEGGNGSDTILGSSGDDHISGGEGLDFLLGNTGSDSFYWSNGDGEDLIGDYDDGGDRIYINGIDLSTLNFRPLSANSSYYFDPNHLDILLHYEGAELTILAGTASASGSVTATQFSPLTGADYGISLGNYLAPTPGPTTVTVTQIGQSSNQVDWQAWWRHSHGQGSVNWSNASINFTATNVPNYQGTNEPPILNYVGFEGGPVDDYLSGDNFNERLSGLGGDDVILGLDGVNWLEGWQGSDTIIGGSGTDYIFGNVAPDLASKLNPQLASHQYLLQFVAEQQGDVNTIDGGAGLDLLVGGEYGDVIVGGTGQDYIWGGTGEDQLAGGDGTDLILGDSAMTFIPNPNGPPGAFIASTVWVDGSEPITTYNDRLTGGEGDDYLWGELGDDELHGGSGNDYLVGDREYNEIFDNTPFISFEGTDPYLSFIQHGNDSLFGGAGDDILIGLDGDDLLSGGRGHDNLWGGADNDIYLLRAGDGTANIVDIFGEHTLLFQGLQPEDLQVVFSGANVHVGNGTDTLTLARSEWQNTTIAIGSSENKVDHTRLDTYYLNSAGETLLFLPGQRGISEADLGELFTIDDSNTEQPLIVARPGAGGLHINSEHASSEGTPVVLSSETLPFSVEITVAPTQADEVLTFVDLSEAPDVGISFTTQEADFTGTDGDDHIVGSSPDNEFYGRGGNDKLEGREGEDTLYGESGDDDLRGGTGADRLYGGQGDDVLEGGADNDWLDGSGGVDRLVGGRGDDTLISRSEATYVFSSGDGNDTIRIVNGATGYSQGTIAFTSDVNFSNIDIEINGADAIIHYGVDDSITLDMNSIQVGQDNALSRFTLTWEGDPETLPLLTQGTATNYLYGSFGDDQIIGISNAVVIIPGYGNDHIDTSAHDSIVYLNHLYLQDAEGIGHKNIHLRGEYDRVVSPVHQGISYHLGGVGQFSRIEYDWSYTSTNPYNIQVNPQQNSVQFVPRGEDVLYFDDGVNFGDLSFTRLGNHLEIGIQGDLGELRIDDFFTAFEVNEPITNISEIATGSFVPDLLTHPYVLSAMPDTPLARIELFDGNSADFASLLSAGMTVVELLPGVTHLGSRRDDVVYGQIDTDDVIQTREGDDLISEEGGIGNNIIDAGAGDDEINAQGNNTIYAGHGNDSVNQTGGAGFIYGGDGGDQLTISGTYDVYGGAGEDVIERSSGAGILDGGTGNDTLTVSGEGMILGGDGNDVITINDGTHTVEGGRGEDQIIISDGINTLLPGENDDGLLIVGGSNTIEDSPGDDEYYILGGSNTINFGNTSGNKLIGLQHGVQNSTVIEIAEGISPEDLIIRASATPFGPAVRLEVVGSDRSIEILPIVPPSSQSSVPDYTVGEIRFSNGTVLTEAEIISTATDSTAQFIVGTAGADVLSGTSSNDTINGLDGADTLTGAEGSDTILGGDGHDTITGGKGNDLLIGEAGDDTFYVEGHGQGFDEIHGGQGFDKLVGSAGNDFFGIAGIEPFHSLDRIEGAGGFDVISGGESNDYIDLTSTELIDIVATLGGAGDDWISVDGGGHILLGQEGDDRLFGGAGDDQFRVGGQSHGYDTINAAGGFDQLIGGEFHDRIGLQRLSASDSLERIDGVTGFDVVSGNDESNYLDFSATELINIVAILGAEGDDTITGSAGNDILIGGAGADVLSGGSGSDLYQMSVGDGHDTIRNTTTIGTDNDQLKLLGIEYDNVWLSRRGDDLVVDYVGSNDGATIEDWYLDESHQLAAIQAGNRVLMQNQVDLLVSAMASFVAPSGVGTVISEETRLLIEPTLSTVWQAA